MYKNAVADNSGKTNTALAAGNRGGFPAQRAESKADMTTALLLCLRVDFFWRFFVTARAFQQERFGLEGAVWQEFPFHNRGGGPLEVVRPRAVEEDRQLLLVAFAGNGEAQRDLLGIPVLAAGITVPLTRTRWPTSAGPAL